MSEVSIGSRAALGLRRGTMAVRIAMMAAVAALLFWIGHWPWAPLWWSAYALLQVSIVEIDKRLGGRGFWPIHLLYFISFSLAGAPTWHLWTKVPFAGHAAATMFLCGMMAQLVASSLAARSLFLCSVAPLAAYLLIVPPLALGPEHGLYAFGIVCCVLLFLGYLGIVWSGQQRVLAAFERSRADAQAASLAKSAFLASISHEIRTPMNAVLGATTLMARTGLDPEQREHVSMLQNGGAVLMQLLNDLLDLSKIEAGKLKVDPVAVDLNAVVRGCAAFWRSSAVDAGLAFAVEVSPDAPRFVALDPVRIGQILSNLIGNAIKFTEKGEIRVAVSVEQIGGQARLAFRVSDTGIGMSSEAMNRLFAPFEQADKSITRRFGGTGLGLAISRELAELMGGGLSVQSREGEGSAFTLHLPMIIAEQPAPPRDETGGEAAPDPPPHVPFRVLLAEDNPANQRIVELFLRPMSVDLTIVGDGQQAVEALMLSPYDVVLMDIQMPVLDGLEASRRVRASDGPNADTPILALTANVLPNQRAACVEAGMTGHIGKPIDARALLTAVVKAGLEARSRRAAETPPAALTG